MLNNDCLFNVYFVYYVVLGIMEVTGKFLLGYCFVNRIWDLFIFVLFIMVRVVLVISSSSNKYYFLFFKCMKFIRNILCIDKKEINL